MLLVLSFAVVIFPATGLLHAAEVAWQKDVGGAARIAARQNKAMLIMVGAEWCGPCHRMLRETFSDSTIAARLNDQFVPVLVDADAQALLVEKLKIDAMPTLLVVNPDRTIVARFTGFQTAGELDARLASCARTGTNAKTPSDLLGRRSLVVPSDRQIQNPFGRPRA
jgi:thiol-disulfide isomerase/thioredoxin